MYAAEHPGHKLCQAIIFLVASQSQWVLSVGNQLAIGRFQKISIPIPRTASRISEGEGGFFELEF